MADNYLARDGNGSLKTFKSKDLGNDVQIAQSVPSDASGQPYSEQNPLPVSGDFNLTTASVEVSNDVGNPIPVSGPLTDTQLRATPVPVSGTVAISNSSVEVANDVGNPVPVSGPVTDTQLRATPVPVSGTVAISNSSVEISNDVGNPVPISGTVAISNSSVEISNDVGNAVPVSGPLTDDQLRASAIPVTAAALPLPTGAATSAQIGEVQASPTANTVLDRLKTLATLLAGGLPAALTSGGGVKTGLVDAVPAGTNSIGAVASNSVLSSATVTRPADTTAYAAKDVISTAVGAVIEFAGMARANGGTGTIVKAWLMTSQSTNTAQYRLHLFHTQPTAIADNAQYAMLIANQANRVGMIDFPACSTEGAGSDAAATMRPSSDGSFPPPNLWYKCAANDTKLYGILETIGVFTPASAQTYFIELGADGLS